MSLVPQQGGMVVLLTFIGAFLLAMFPLPEWAQVMRPEWVVLVLIYWCMALPHRYGVFVAWFVGLFLDVAQGALLGQNAIAVAVVAFLTIKLHLRIRVFPLWQQAMSILLLIALYQMMILWIKNMVGVTAHGWSYWLHSMFSMLVWPMVFLSLRNIRRRYRVR